MDDGTERESEGFERRPVALVTGASAGIGEELARQLAGLGYDLVLVARSRDRLERLGLELRARHGAGASVLVADLATEEGLGVVLERIGNGDPPDVVVNNAGFGWYGSYTEQPEAEVRSMVAVNVLAVSAIARAALAVMIPRGSGSLMNVASTAAFSPGPGGALYHATKAFVLSLSTALHEEARASGVHVSALCPGFTPTEFQARAQVSTSGLPGPLVTSAEEVARAGLLGLGNNQAVCIPGTLNKVLATLSRIGPPSLVRRGASRFLRRI